jgi:transcriptional regulator with XRE-family HTH domain
LQGGQVRLKCLKPDGIPERAKNPQTLGDHLLARRLSLSLTQAFVARMIGVSEHSYLHWEKDQLPPRVSMYPAIHAFLGGDPLPPAKTLSQRLLRFRRAHGLSVKNAARLLGYDEATWAGWEHGKRVQKAQLIDIERLAVEMGRQVNDLAP